MDPSLRERVQCVSFDAVGTLIRARPAVAAAYSQVGLAHGSGYSRAQVEPRFRQAFDAAEERDARGSGETSEELERERWRRIVAEVLDDVADLEPCFEELFAHFGKASSWEIYPDVRSTLERLHQGGLQITMASNFDARLLDVVAGHETFAAISPVVHSAGIGFRKPDARFFAALSESVGHPPEAILHVGDDPVNDIQGAQDAGHPALLIDRGGPSSRGGITSLVEVCALLQV